MLSIKDELIPIPEPEPEVEPTPDTSDDFFLKTYSWNSQIGSFSIKDFRIVKENYRKAKDYNKSTAHKTGGYPFQYYADRVIDGQNDDLKRLIKKIAETHVDKSYIQKIDNILQFVHDPNFKYSYDINTTGFEDYARYPVETIVDKTGDCDCLSILVTSLYKLHGYKSALIFVEGHAMAGIEIPERINLPGNWVEKGSIRYFICEATGSGWKVGQKQTSKTIEEIIPV